MAAARMCAPCVCALLPLWFPQYWFSPVRNRIVNAATRITSPHLTSPHLTSLTHCTHSLHSLTPLTHSLTPLTHSLTHSLHSLTPLTHSTHSLHSLTPLTHSLTHSTHSTHSLHSLIPLYILLALPAVVGIRPLDSFDGRFECVTF